MTDEHRAPRVGQRARRFSRRWMLRGLGVVGLGSGALALTPARSNAYYNGPISDHFDGVRFFNPGGDSPRGFGHFLRWQLTSRAEAWPASYTHGPEDAPPAKVEGKRLRVTALGHASFLIQTQGRAILIDPVYATRASPVSFVGPKRVNAPGVAFDRLPKIDSVLITHNHFDHMDVEVIGRLWQRDRVQVITPLGNDTILKGAVPDLDVRALDWGQVAQAGPHAVHAVPTQHWSARGTRDRMHALWASFVIETGQKTIYAVGDSGFGDGQTFRSVAQRFPNLVLALLPIGAYEPRWFMSTQHMNPAEAVEAFRIVQPKLALGHHWGTFQLTNEAIDAPPRALMAALVAASVAPERFRAVRPGDVTEMA
jgi:L-ascorbate metabolism protein UlaG (beta-lactamase superfamily)